MSSFCVKHIFRICNVRLNFNVCSLRYNCYRAALTKTRREHYVYTYPTMMVFPNGSTITIPYKEPRKIIKVSYSACLHYTFHYKKLFNVSFMGKFAFSNNKRMELRV